MRLKPRARDGIYILTYYDSEGTRHRVSTGCREKADAEREAQKILAGTGERARPKTLGEALDAAWAKRWEGQKGSQKSKYVYLLLHKRCGSTPCMDVTYAWLEGLVEEWQDDGKSASTINQRLTMLNVAMDLAAKRGWMVAVPPIPRQAVKNTKIRFASYEEEDRLLAACSVLGGGDRSALMQNLIQVLVDTGCRLGEITMLRPEDLRGDEIVLMDTKNGKSRVVPLTARAATCLRHLRMNPLWQVVTARVHSSKVRKESAKDFCVKQFTKVRNHAELPDISLHTLRHTCASRLVQAGVSIYEVKDWLGHSSVVVTERYAHLAESTLKNRVSALERPVAPVVKLRS